MLPAITDYVTDVYYGVITPRQSWLLVIIPYLLEPHTQPGGFSLQYPDQYWHHSCLHTWHFLFLLFRQLLVFLKLLVVVPS